MKTALAAAAAAAVLLLAAPSRAAGKQKTAAPKAPVDPLHWDTRSRASADQWYAVTIEGEKYLAYIPNKSEQRTPAYKAKDGAHVWQSPLFKITVKAKDAKTPDTAQVTTEDKGLVLEGGGSAPKVVCADQAKCKGIDVSKAGMPRLLRNDPSALPGFDSKSTDLKLAVYAPDVKLTAPGGAGGTDKPANVDTSPDLGPWEQAATAKDSIAAFDENDLKNAGTNAKKRAAISAHLKSYMEASKDSVAPLTLNEIAFIDAVAKLQPERHIPIDGVDAAAALKKADPKDPTVAAFIARWRTFVRHDVELYQNLGNDDLRHGYPGNPQAVGDVNKDIVEKGTGPGSDLDLALAKAHPGATRQAEAQRKIVAAYIKAHPDSKDPDERQLLASVSQGNKAAFDRLWNNITGGERLKDAVLKHKSDNHLEGLVDSDTLLDAYCTPGQFHGGAVAEPPKASAKGQVTQFAKDSKAAAGSTNLEDTGTGAGSVEGSGKAPVSANDPCSGRLQQLQSQFPQPQPTGTKPMLVDNQAVPPVATGDHQKGANVGPQASGGDSKMGDHVRAGALVGTFLGMLGLFTGGPLGMLLLGGAGFAIGFGINYVTNKAK